MLFLCRNSASAARVSQKRSMSRSLLQSSASHPCCTTPTSWKLLISFKMRINIGAKWWSSALEETSTPQLRGKSIFDLLALCFSFGILFLSLSSEKVGRKRLLEIFILFLGLLLISHTNFRTCRVFKFRRACRCYHCLPIDNSWLRTWWWHLTFDLNRVLTLLLRAVEWAQAKSNAVSSKCWMEYPTSTAKALHTMTSSQRTCSLIPKAI